MRKTKEELREWQRLYAKKRWDSMTSEERRASHFDYYENNRDKIAKQHHGYMIKRKYGITVYEYNELFEKQCGCCAICGIHQEDLKRALAVDHNHTTKEVRGLLCPKCNAILGYANDSINILISATDYLFQYK
jgi:hypothetical protein